MVWRLPYVVVFLGLVALVALALPTSTAEAATVCGAITVPWTSPVDDRDCDGFSDSLEAGYGINPHPSFANGTMSKVACSATSTPNDETGDYAYPSIPNGWPADFNDDQFVDGADVLTFGAYFLTQAPPGSPQSRWDLTANGFIDGSDVLRMGQFFQKTCNVMFPTEPASTTSRYMSTIDPGVMFEQGCAAGEANYSGSVILAWGQPWWQLDGGYGTVDYSTTFRTNSQILASVRYYIFGFWVCTPVGGPHIKLAVGTSNYAGTGYGYVPYGHGQSWAQLVNQIDQYIDQQGFRSQVDAVGGIDAETGWAGWGLTSQWVAGYDSANGSEYYDFGTAGGCPEQYSSGLLGFACSSNWTVSNVVDMAWGNNSPGYPFPEIYRRDGVNAAQWQTLSLVSYIDRGLGEMNFVGALTQRQACEQADPPDPDCVSHLLDNDARHGWRQLWLLLARDTITANILEFSTDIEKNNDY